MIAREANRGKLDLTNLTLILGEVKYLREDLSKDPDLQTASPTPHTSHYKEGLERNETHFL